MPTPRESGLLGLCTTVKAGPPRFFLDDRVNASSCCDIRSTGDPAYRRGPLSPREDLSESTPDPSLEVSEGVREVEGERGRCLPSSACS